MEQQIEARTEPKTKIPIIISSMPENERLLTL
jgi:hypothetical protein